MSLNKLGSLENVSISIAHLTETRCLQTLGQPRKRGGTFNRFLWKSPSEKECDTAAIGQKLKLHEMCDGQKIAHFTS